MELLLQVELFEYKRFSRVISYDCGKYSRERVEYSLSSVHGYGSKREHADRNG